MHRGLRYALCSYMHLCCHPHNDFLYCVWENAIWRHIYIELGYADGNGMGHGGSPYDMGFHTFNFPLYVSIGAIQAGQDERGGGIGNTSHTHTHILLLYFVCRFIGGHYWRGTSQPSTDSLAINLSNMLFVLFGRSAVVVFVGYCTERMHIAQNKSFRYFI